MKLTTKFLLELAAAAGLLGLAACGGGSSGGGSTPPPPAKATALAYTDPTSGIYRLVKDSASTATTLVLDLTCPSSASTTTGCGLTFSFTVDTTMATWVKSPSVVTSGQVFNLGTGVQVVTGKVAGQELQGIVSQKGVSSPVSLGSGVLAQIRLDMVSGINTGTISLADGGKGTLLTPTSISPITVMVGTLQAK